MDTSILPLSSEIMFCSAKLTNHILLKYVFFKDHSLLQRAKIDVVFVTSITKGDNYDYSDNYYSVIGGTKGGA